MLDDASAQTISSKVRREELEWKSGVSSLLLTQLSYLP
jgi:hypothetical protein